MDNITNNNPTCCVIGHSECCLLGYLDCVNACYQREQDRTIDEAAPKCKPKSIREQIEKDICDGCQ